MIILSRTFTDGRQARQGKAKMAGSKDDWSQLKAVLCSERYLDRMIYDVPIFIVLIQSLSSAS